MDNGTCEVEFIHREAHLDVRNVAQVRSVLNEALEEGTCDVVLDVAALHLVDAAGLGMLTAAHVRAERAGRRLILRNCSDEVRRVLAVTHLNRILRIERTPQPSAQLSTRSNVRSLFVASSAATL